MSNMQQKVGESRQAYLTRARNWARRKFNELRTSDEFRYSHSSHAVAKALELCERLYTDVATFGVEHIGKGRNSRPPAITYLNAGDAYETTILHVNGQFRVGDWGSIVERGNYE